MGRKQALNMKKTFQATGYEVIAADLEGDIDRLKPGHTRLILALGNEASGLSEDVLNLSDSRIRIPIEREKAESLNVATSGAILMYIAREASL